MWIIRRNQSEIEIVREGEPFNPGERVVVLEKSDIFVLCSRDAWAAKLRNSSLRKNKFICKREVSVSSDGIIKINRLRLMVSKKDS